MLIIADIQAAFSKIVLNAVFCSFYFLILFTTKIELIIKSKTTRNSYSISYDRNREFSLNYSNKI